MKLTQLILLIFGLVKGYEAFPMCTNGEPPLMERNDAFSCDRGCPMGFICEFQDSDRRMENGICCANETALMEIYGDMMKIEPVWSPTEAPENTEATTIHVISPPGLKPPKSFTFPPQSKQEEDARQYNNPFGVTVSAKEVVESTKGPQPPQSTTTEGSIAKFIVSSETSNQETRTEDEQEKNYTEVMKSEEGSHDRSSDEEKLEKAIKEEMSMSRQQQSKNSQENVYEQSVTSTETTTVFSEEPVEMFVTVISSQEVSAVGEKAVGADDHANTEHIVEEKPTAPALSQSDGSEKTSLEGWIPEENTGTAASNEEYGASASQPGQGKNTTINIGPNQNIVKIENTLNNRNETELNITSLVSPNVSNSSSLIEDIEDVSASLGETNSIAPESVSLENEMALPNNTTDRETLDIFMDDQLDNSTIALGIPDEPQLGSVFENMTDVSNSTESGKTEEKQELYSCHRQIYKFTCQEGIVKTQPTIRWAWNEGTNSCEFYPWGYCPGDRVKDSTTIRTKEECLAHCRDRVPASMQDAIGEKGPVEDRALTYEAKVSFASPKVSVSLSRKTLSADINNEEATSDNLLPIITTDPALVHVIAVTDPRSEAKSLLNVEEIEEVTTRKPTTKPLKNGKKSSLHIETNQEENQVLCTETSYRYVCASGMPSQFVYRWQVIDGKCRSFPYGYCWGELNHAHPRSRAECQKYCPVGLPTNYFRVL